MIMKNLMYKMIAVGIVALMATTSLTQTSPQLELPKVNEAQIISVAFSGTGIGIIKAADEQG